MSRVIRSRVEGFRHDSGVRHGRLSGPTRYRLVFPAGQRGRGLARRRRALAVADRHPDGAVDPGDHGDGPAGLIPASSWTRLQGAAWPAPTGIATGFR